MMLPPPYSYSNFSLYLACPAKHNYQRILKIVPDEAPNMEAADRGKFLHKVCEDYINGAINVIPAELKQFQPVLEKLKAQGAKSEVQLACTQDMQPCAYDDPNAFFYGVIDTLEVSGTLSQVGDWKSGKKRDYSSQLEFYSMLQLINSESSKILTRIRYIDLGISDPGPEFTRRDLPKLWDKYTNIVKIMTKDRIRSPKPNEFCKFCPYNSKKMGVCKW